MVTYFISAHPIANSYVFDQLAPKGSQRGERSRLALALNCQKAFISQVLADRAHFSVEHAIQIAQFLELDAHETDFFLLLVHLARSANNDARSRNTF